MTGMEVQRGYYAIIPAKVRYDKMLPANAKLLYGEITALCNEKGFCWAGNGYFAELYGVSNISISNWITKLEKCGYIYREIIYKGGTKEIEKRLLYLDPPIKENFNTPKRKVKEGIKEIFNTPIKENFKDNNTGFNNTENNTINNMLQSNNTKITTKKSFSDIGSEDNILDAEQNKLKGKKVQLMYNKFLEAENSGDFSKIKPTDLCLYFVDYQQRVTGKKVNFNMYKDVGVMRDLLVNDTRVPKNRWKEFLEVLIDIRLKEHPSKEYPTFTFGQLASSFTRGVLISKVFGTMGIKLEEVAVEVDGNKKALKTEHTVKYEGEVYTMEKMTIDQILALEEKSGMDFEEMVKVYGI